MDASETVAAARDEKRAELERANNLTGAGFVRALQAIARNTGLTDYQANDLIHAALWPAAAGAGDDPAQEAEA